MKTMPKKPGQNADGAKKPGDQQANRDQGGANRDMNRDRDNNANRDMDRNRADRDRGNNR